MKLSDPGKTAVNVVAVLAIGFCLGVASHVTLPIEAIVALLTGATALLLLGSFDWKE